MNIYLYFLGAAWIVISAVLAEKGKKYWAVFGFGLAMLAWLLGISRHIITTLGD